MLLKEILDEYVIQESKKYKEFGNYEFSDDFKRKINKVFRDIIGTEKLPHPEVENR